MAASAVKEHDAVVAAGKPLVSAPLTIVKAAVMLVADAAHGALEQLVALSGIVQGATEKDEVQPSADGDVNHIPASADSRVNLSYPSDAMAANLPRTGAERINPLLPALGLLAMGALLILGGRRKHDER